MREQITESKMHALDYWQVVRNRWGTILLTFLLVCLSAMIIISLLEKKHIGRVRIQVQHDSQGTVFNKNYVGGSGNWLETEFKIITARETMLRVVRKLGLAKKWNLGTDENTTIAKLTGMVETSEERGTDIIAIEVYSPKPDEAAELANAVADAYEERRKETEKGRSESAINMLAMELDDQRKQVDSKRIEMIRIMKQYNIIDFSGMSGWIGAENSVANPDQGTYTSARQHQEDFRREVSNLELQLNALLAIKEQDRLIEYAGTLNIEGMSIKETLPKFRAMQLEVGFLKDGGLGDKHPRVIAARGQVENMSKQLTRAVESFKDTIQTRIDIAKASLQALEESTGKSEEKLVGDKSRHAEYLTAKKEYEQQFLLLQQMQEHILKQKVDLEMPMMPVVRHENAFQSNEVVRPNTQMLLAVGSMVGLVLGIVLAFFLEYMDTSVKTLDDVERYLGVPVLAVIPKDVGVLHKQSGLSPDAEAYRILRTNIEFNRKSADANAITIVSGGAGEGKSTTLVNLAYICAQGGYNTLMIDGDLRRPKLHTFFDINNSVGLTNYLTTALQLEDVILQTPIDNLYFMPSGILPADAAGILNSRRMSELIQDLKNRFDLVLIDSPPILGVSDASVLASEVDLTIIVIQHRKLPRNMLMRVKQAVENVGGNVLGVVLNNVDVRSDSQYQYYTSYYTYYSPTSAESKPKSRPSRDKSAASAPSQPTSAPLSGEDEEY